jgi:hypothetical protein
MSDTLSRHDLRCWKGRAGKVVRAGWSFGNRGDGLKDQNEKPARKSRAGFKLRLQISDLSGLLRTLQLEEQKSRQASAKQHYRTGLGGREAVHRDSG